MCKIFKNVEIDKHDTKYNAKEEKDLKKWTKYEKLKKM